MKHKREGDYVVWIAVIIIIIAIILCIIFKDKLNAFISSSDTVEKQGTVIDWLMEGQVNK